MKKIILLVVVGLLIAGGAGGWFMTRSRSAVEVVSDELSEAADKGGEVLVGKLKEMVMRGVPLKCTFEDNGVSGTSYIKGEKYYGEISGEEGTSYVIVVDDCMWAWGGGQPQGMKTCFETEEGEEGDESGDFWEGKGESSPQGEFNCRPAAITDSRFTPPNDIGFMNLDQMMGGFGY